jgi:cyclopropane-fatty-acyl-phospholipid synthase
VNSRLYRGDIAHVRSHAARHAFGYPVYFYVFDLAELDELQQRIPVFGHNRRRLVSLYDRDYLTPGPEPLRQKVEAVLLAHDCADGVDRVRLLTSARVCGYVFNPVSFFYCLRADGSLRCVIANVNNTFGDSHLYVLKDSLPPPPGMAAHFQAVKEFHVSPFFDLDGRYDFQFTPPGDTVAVRLQLHKQDKIAFVAQLRGTGRELTTGTLLGTLLCCPLTHLLTMPRILWQAARLYFQRRLPVYPRPNPRSPMTVRTAPPSWSRRLAMRGVTHVLEQLHQGELELALPDRRVGRFGTPGSEPRVRVDVRNWDFFWRLAKDGDIGLGEAYMAGDWECADPAAFLRLLLQNWDRIAAVRGAWLARTLNYLRHLRRANTLTGSRRNIHEHYDVSNDFFRLFLDPTLLYSCAWFAAETTVGKAKGDPLTTAQLAKIGRLLDKAQIGPDDHVLEIGCGWGAFAIEAVRRTGCRITGITVSEEQLKLARERVAAAGLTERIRIELCDYRHVQGSFSRIVSIEMLEAVGHQYLGAYFAALDRLLAPGGRGVIQVITIPDARYHQYRHSSDFIRRHIFPGGHLPCLAALREAAARGSRLEIRELESIGLHYVPTLRHWRERLLANAGAARALGFDAVFLRKWEFYFVYCEAAFAERLIDDVQLTVRNQTAIRP